MIFIDECGMKKMTRIDNSKGRLVKEVQHQRFGREER